MSVIGIDFGNESCYIAAAMAGGIETLVNDYSLRATPSCVAFHDKRRLLGVAAKNQQLTNITNTIVGFKRLLGRKFNDPQVQCELKTMPNKVDQQSDGSIGFKVNYLCQEQYYSPLQITAMLFTQLRETSSSALQVLVRDCVITCPVYYTNAERRALLDAAEIAGFNVLRLMNETTATALSYGFYKVDLSEDEPRNVIIVDCGYSSLQVSACAFTKGKLKMIANAWDTVGGRDVDALLADHFAQEFRDRYKIDVNINTRYYLRLLIEVEKLKRQMSANSSKLPLNLECFFNDIDVFSSMQRSEMEELCAPLFYRVEQTFKKLLKESKLSLDDIHSIEIVGGSTRIPAIKQLIEQVFGKPASNTLYQDESVSRGAALQCALMSPAMRTRDFGVTDIQNYAVKLSWDGEDAASAGEIEVFNTFHAAPFSRLWTMYRKQPFTMTVQYAESIPYPDPIIGKWMIKNIKSDECGEQEVKVKVRINHHGIVTIMSATIVENALVEVACEAATQAEGQLQTQPSSSVSQNSNDAAENTDVSMEDLSQKFNEKKKTSLKVIELPMEARTHGLTEQQMALLVKEEIKMIGDDARETKRVDARNALEEFVYEMRDKLQGGSLQRYVSQNDCDTLCQELFDLENWIYEDGRDCDRDTYVKQLMELQTKTAPIYERAADYENCPIAFNDLKYVIDKSHFAVQEFERGVPKYSHLSEVEFLNVSEAADKAQKWFSQKWGAFSQTPQTANSPVHVAEIRHETQVLNTCLNAVIYRPKPQPPALTPSSSGSNTSGVDPEANAKHQQQQESSGCASHENASNRSDESIADVE